jgi:hypothetical protein
VRILEDQYQRLHLAFPEQNALEGVERALAALGRLESQERAVRREGLQQEQDRGDGFVERSSSVTICPVTSARIVLGSSPSWMWT